MEPMLVLAIIIAAAEVVVAIVLLEVFSRIGPSPYSHALRVSCCLAIPAAAMQPITASMAGGAFAISASVASFCLYTLTSAFVLTQLEFVKTLALLFTAIGAPTITLVQVAVGILCVPYIASSFNRLFSSSTINVVTAISVAWSGIIALLDLAQQVLLLLSVLFRLPGATVAFKAGYMCLVFFAWTLLVAGATIVLSRGPRHMVAVGNLCVPAFILSSFMTMEIFRIALQRTVRLPVADGKDGRNDRRLEQRPSNTAMLSDEHTPEPHDQGRMHHGSDTSQYPSAPTPTVMIEVRD
ncbi:hypothetical protein BC831DRAFT_442523 [Entophlyctis helioformis]|nr:hypothetical protein BC831DRAFT_442523 [Entophlyctis helioformis]